MAGVFGSGASGLRTAQVALDVIGHNIANANTPGYSRQSTTISTQSPTQTGNGFIGGGVIATGVISSVDAYLEKQLTEATTQKTQYGALNSLYQTLQQRISGDANGIGKAMSGFNSALSQASANPNSLPARQLVLTQAEDLIQRFKTTAEFITNERARASDGIMESTSRVNDLFQRIADLNDKIAKVEPRTESGTVIQGMRANDLRDQRQLLINELSGYVNIQTISTNDGETLMINGVAAVIGNQYSQLGVVADTLDPTKPALVLKSQSGDIVLSAEQLGGKMGAYADYLNNGLEGARATLNQLAAMFIEAVNTSQTQGTDLQGNAGVALIGPSPVPTTAKPSTSNQGTGTIDVQVDLKNSVAADYRVRFANGQYQMVRLTDNALVASGTPDTTATPNLTLNVDGMSIKLDGTPMEGDAWLVRPFGDSANGMKLLQLDPKKIALSTPVAVVQDVANKGTAQASSIKVTALPPMPANLKESVSITFTDANTFTVSSASLGTITGVAYSAESPISYNGWEFSINGVPKAGDTFTVKDGFPNPGDGSNGNKMLEALTGRNFLGGSATLSDVFALLQSDVGSKAGLASSKMKSSDTMYQIAVSERESFSGVNLDEEAANLVRWQQIYQANAKVLTVTQELFQNLVQSF